MRWAWRFLVVAAPALSGCAMCCSPYDCDYAHFGGSWERVDRSYGRVGSLFTPEVGVKVGEGAGNTPSQLPPAAANDNQGDLNSESQELPPPQPMPQPMLGPEPAAPPAAPEAAPAEPAPPPAAPDTTYRPTPSGPYPVSRPASRPAQPVYAPGTRRPNSAQPYSPRPVQPYLP